MVAPTPRRSIPPKILEPIGRELRITDCVLDVAVPEIGLQRPGVDAGLGEFEPAGVAQHVRMRLDLEFGRCRSPLDHCAKPRRDSGAPRSDTKTKGDCGLSLWCRRNSRSSRPVRGCVLGVPFLSLRMARDALLKSTCSQRRSTNSDALRPCL